MASTASGQAPSPGSFRHGALVPVSLAVLSSALLFSASCGRAAPEEYVPRYGSTAAVQRQVLTFGVLPQHNPQRLHQVYGPLSAYLSRHLSGVTVELQASRSYDEFEKKLAARSLHLALPNPYQTLMALPRGYRIFGKMGDDEKFRGILLVRKDSGIETVGDLRGKVVSFPAPTALAATMMPLYFLKTNGLDVESGIQRLFVGSQESSIMSVYLRRSAAGATWPPPWESFVRAEPEKARQLVRLLAEKPGEKVIVFKKRRRHNYRRKNGHRQNHTILKIVSIGAAEKKAKAAKAEAPVAEAAPAAEAAAPAPKKAPAKKAAAPKTEA